MNFSEKMIFCRMIKEIENAIKHFVENIYDELETSDYKQSIRFYVANFKKNGFNNGTGSLGVSKAVEILTKFGYNVGVEYPHVVQANNFFKKNQQSMKRNIDNEDLRKKAEENRKKIKEAEEKRKDKND